MSAARIFGPILYDDVLLKFIIDASVEFRSPKDSSITERVLDKANDPNIHLSRLYCHVEEHEGASSLVLELLDYAYLGLYHNVTDDNKHVMELGTSFNSDRSWYTLGAALKAVLHRLSINNKDREASRSFSVYLPQRIPNVDTTMATNAN